ncbi:MAG: HD domain-containing protein [Armatimonadota bacterium]|nr:HD domain-containing protein [Armatimonadota bacterium]
MMTVRGGIEWWPLSLRGFAVLFGLSVLLIGTPTGPAILSPVVLLLVLLFATGLLSALAQRSTGPRPAASYTGTVLELAIVSFIVYETGGLASFFYFFYVPVLIWGTAGRTLAAGVAGGWLAATGFSVAASLRMEPSAAVLPRAALLLLMGVLVGLIEQRRGEAEAAALRGARQLTRQAETAAEIRAALMDMAPLDLPRRAQVLLACARRRLADAATGLVIVLDIEGRPVVEASAGPPGGERPRGEVLPKVAVLQAALDGGRLQSVVDASVDPRWVGVFGGDAAGSALLLPFRVEGLSIGALFLGRREVRLFSQEAVDAVRQLTEMASLLIYDARMQGWAADFQLSAVNMLAAALEAKDPYTRGHSQRVASAAVALAAELGLPAEEVERIRWASLLHDIGKISTPEHILRKRGSLSDEERAVMNRHPERGASILSEMAPFRPLVDYVRSHQEAWDGSGYPDGLAGTAIPVGARIIRVADTFDALISDRPYRRGRTVEEAMAELRTMAGSALDPGLVDVFLRILRDKPPFEVQLRMWRER